MRAVSDLYGIPEAAVLAVAAGTTCSASAGTPRKPVTSRCAGPSARRWPAAAAAERLAEAQQNVARLRDWLAEANPAEPESDRLGAHVGLVAARRAVRATSITTGAAPGPLADPVVVELAAQENIAVGDVPWGLRPWVPAASIQRVPAGLAVSEAAEVAKAALARAAGRPLIVVVRDAHRYPAVRAVVSELTAARPDTVVLEMGLPSGCHPRACIWPPTARPGPTRRPRRRSWGWSGERAGRLAQTTHDDWARATSSGPDSY